MVSIVSSSFCIRGDKYQFNSLVFLNPSSLLHFLTKWVITMNLCPTFSHSQMHWPSGKVENSCSKKEYPKNFYLIKSLQVTGLHRVCFFWGSWMRIDVDSCLLCMSIELRFRDFCGILIVMINMELNLVKYWRKMLDKFWKIMGKTLISWSIIQLQNI
jgi:hypothetical protein